MGSKLTAYLSLFRLHQYVKNFFIFVPLFFAGKIGQIDLLIEVIIAFSAFSIIASSIYIINDYKDIEDDKRHPTKKNRALASGAVNRKEGVILFVFLVLIGFGITAYISPKAIPLFLVYFILNLAYSFKLKSLALIDVSIISIGFVIRLFIGSIVTGVELSMWIVIMTFLLALYLAFAKRRDDVLIFMETGSKMRKAIEGYNLEFLNAAMIVTGAVTIVAYVMFTVSPDVIRHYQSRHLYLTAFFVIFGVLRYMQITYVENNSGSPTKLIFKDLYLQATLLGWFCFFIWLLYF